MEPLTPQGTRSGTPKNSKGSQIASMTASQVQKYEFLVTSDINLSVRIKISHMEGAVLREGILDENYSVECYLHAEGRELCQRVRTSHNSFCTDARCWEQWIVLPVQYCHLPLDTHLIITVWGVATLGDHIPIAGSSFPLFTESHTLHRGRHKLILWLNTEGDPQIPSSTLGKPPLGDLDQLHRLEKASKWYDQRLFDHVDWLDALSLERLDALKRKIMEEQIGRLFLHIEFPSFAKPVLYHEVTWLYPHQSGAPQPDVSAPIVTDLEAPRSQVKDRIVLVRDYEMGMENPVDTKHMKLSRSFRRGVFDRNLIPNASERKLIHKLIKSPSTKILNQKEKDFVWKFRYFLKDNRKALPKFLKCVDWDDAQQRKQANELMWKWDPMDASDALELLDISFGSVTGVREYAISRLRTSDNEELRSYLFPLVASLRYEEDSNLLGQFLVEKALQNELFANNLYWFLLAEAQTPHKFRTLYQNHIQELKCGLVATSSGSCQLNVLERQELLLDSIRAIQAQVMTLNKDRKKRIEKMIELIQPPLKIAYAGLGEKNLSDLPLMLKPEVKVTKVVPEESYIFKSAMQPLRISFTIKSQQFESWRISRSSTSRIEGERGEGEREGREGGERGGEEEGEREKVFKVIYKKGDDLRQDQLMMQMISLMNMLLCKENLDLRLTPYKILATSFDDGFVECVADSYSIASILENGDIRKFLLTNNPAPEGSVSEGGINPVAMDNFIRSCAGYCVITYILGIGDRHLDNLLMTKHGHLFHIDFGYILGMDPKPFPPPMKLCKEMVEAMGGANSKTHTKFKEHCCEAYNILRKSSNLILNLVSLALHAGILPHDPEKSILKVQEKFRLELTDEEASQAFQSLIKMSVSALFPQLLEPLHRWAQYWRS